MSEELTPPVEVVKPVKRKFRFTAFHAIMIGLLLGFIGHAFFVHTYVVPSSSMSNTLQVKDYIVSIPALDNTKPPARGTVIVFNPPSSWGQPEGTVYVKRVIAVGGDTISCCSANGKVIVNGKEINEPYLRNGVNDLRQDFSYTVPEGELFVMGDNRLNSADSRYHPQDPFVPVSSVLGQPKFIVWPLNHFSTDLN